MTLDDILALWETECVIGDDLEKESKNIPKLHHKYLSLLSNTRLAQIAKEEELHELTLKKWRWLNGYMTKEEIDQLGWDHDPFSGAAKPLKSKLDMYMEADKDLSVLKMKVAYLKEKRETLEEIVRALNWRHTHIKNIIDNKRFESGY
jgi:hypothetical protein